MTLRDWLQAQPFTLSMSSGFFSFFAHCGMLSVLEEEALLPTKITGSSAGALVGACWASGCTTHELKERLFTLDKGDFWDPAPGFGLLKGNKFRNMVSEVCQVDRLQDCHVSVVLSAFDLLTCKTHRLTEGPIQQAISASCAFPLLFQPVLLNSRYYLDGGIRDRPGMSGVVSGERVFYHHIASRSPWRRKNSRALQLPTCTNIQSLAIEGLPRVGPNSLPMGKAAFEMAQHKTRITLDAPLTAVKGI